MALLHCIAFSAALAAATSLRSWKSWSWAKAATASSQPSWRENHGSSVSDDSRMFVVYPWKHVRNSSCCGRDFMGFMLLVIVYSHCW